MRITIVALGVGSLLLGCTGEGSSPGPAPEAPPAEVEVEASPDEVPAEPPAALDEPLRGALSRGSADPSPGEARPPAPLATATAAEVVARFDLDTRVTTRLAFGEGGQWWAGDGWKVQAYRDGEARGEPITDEELLAAEPQVAVGQGLVVGSSLVGPRGIRPVPSVWGMAASDGLSPHGGYERTHVAWTFDASAVVIASHWRPGRCCRKDEPVHEPPRNIVDVIDFVAGEHQRIPSSGPVAIGPDRVVLRGTLYARAPLHAMHSPLTETSPQAVAMDPRGELIAVATSSGELALHRASDGLRLRHWKGRSYPQQIAWHPRYDVIAVASVDDLDLWAVDGERPRELASAPLELTTQGLAFSPSGDRLVVAAMRGVVLDFAFETKPTILGPRPLRDALETPPPADWAWNAKQEVGALTVDDQRVHAFGRGLGLFAFDRATGRREGSWQRRQDDRHGVAAAARAPVFAMVDNPHDRDEDTHTQEVEIVDATTYAVTHSRYIDEGEVDHLVLSSRGTSFAWSLRDDPIVTLMGADGGTLMRLHAASNAVEAVAISDDDRRLAVANRHVDDNVFVGTVAATPGATPEVLTITTPRGVRLLRFSPDGARLYVVDFDGKVHVVDAHAGTLLHTWESGLSWVRVLEVSADGERLALGEDRVVVIDTKTGATVATLGAGHAIRSVAIAERGELLVAGDTEGGVLPFRLP